jgi:hypothetical protein
VPPPPPPPPPAISQAARALSNLIVATENRRQVVEEDGIQSLLRCAQFGSEAVQEAVTRVLVNLSYEAHIGRCACMIWQWQGLAPTRPPPPLSPTTHLPPPPFLPNRQLIRHGLWRAFLAHRRRRFSRRRSVSHPLTTHLSPPPPLPDHSSPPPFSPNRHLIRHGAMPVVASLLGSPSEKVQQEAAWVAVNVSLCSDTEPEAAAPQSMPAGGAQSIPAGGAQSMPAGGGQAIPAGGPSAAGEANLTAAGAVETSGAVHGANAQGGAAGPSTVQPPATFGEEVCLSFS